LHKQPRVNEIWDIYNFTAEYHAFHIHQLGFGVIQSCAPKYLSDQGKGPDCTAIVDDSGDEDHEANLLLDVINVPFAISIPHSDGTKTAYYPGKVTINVPFTQGIVGDFVLHCHLLEHEDNGMMLGIQVWPDDIPK
jgi:FtsP/CotA-like multicopper oxidase with cupredoxin domain